MTKRIYRRLLLLAITLLMTLSLIGSSSRQQAATQTCEDCLYAAEEYYYSCIDWGQDPEQVCRRGYDQRVKLCYYNGYCPAP